MERIKAEQTRCDREIRRLMREEDFTKGIFFPAEIHALHQEKNMLSACLQQRRARLGRLKLGTGH